MLTMRVVHAHEGDSFLLLYGSAANRRALLCDGGPRDTFEPHLRETLEGLGIDTLDAVILSHVDNDHVLGLLDLFAKVRDQRAAHETPLVAVGDVWINEFDRTVDRSGTLQPRLAGVLQSMAAQSMSMTIASAALAGVREGHKLNVMARQLGLQVNGVRTGGPFLADGSAPFDLFDLNIRIVGPTRANLDALAAAWAAWLDKQEDKIGRGKFNLAAMADKSVPNLSSIQLLVTGSGKTLLLTGDGRGDHLLEALNEAGLLDEDGAIEVDLLKVPHHGSDRNVTRRFFEQVRARTYVISANGKHGNPDLPTLEWIIASAAEAPDPITIVVTNQTKSVDQVTKALPPDDNNYRLRVRTPNEHFIDVKLA